MAIAAGTIFGPYEVVGILGSGGKGDVFRARDTRLGRDVALKVLPERFASDAERLARFKREAQVLASLNYPHIGAIYGFEESTGVRALVLELVEGETLADRIARGPIPVDQALVLARQIADALEVAHEKGIVHRDLKPANIKDRQRSGQELGLRELRPVDHHATLHGDNQLAGDAARPPMSNRESKAAQSAA
jgi:serine/threonine-protein kinase